MDLLAEMIQQLGVKRGTFTLSSGKHSDLYFDMKPVLFNPLGSYLIGTRMLEFVSAIGTYGSVGGLETGAIPVVSAMIAHFETIDLSKSISGFFIRKERREHATKQLVEGLINLDLPVVIVDDVVSTGTSIKQAVDVVHELGGRIAYTCAIVDRQLGAKEYLNQNGINFSALYREDDFLHTSG